MKKVNTYESLIRWLIISFSIITILSIPIFMLFKPFNDWSFVPNAELFGQYGNFIGGLFGTLVSLLAAVLLYYTLIYQRSTLQNQQESFEIERFETTFFNLLKTQRDIRNEISAFFPFIDENVSLRWQLHDGLSFFQRSKRELSQIWKSLENHKYLGKFYEDDIEWIKYKIEKLYENGTEQPKVIIDPVEEEKDILSEENIKLINRYYKISDERWQSTKNKTDLVKVKNMASFYFEKYHYAIGYYFSHLYHILNLTISNESLIDKMKYISLIQAQMPSFELMLLFYYSFLHPKLHNILMDYNFLENLVVEDLVDKSHNCIEGITLKSRTDLIGTKN